MFHILCFGAINNNNNLVIYFSCAYTFDEVLELEYPRRHPQRSTPKREVLTFEAPVEKVGGKATMVITNVVKTRHRYRD
jgi:hypothetical protein